MLAIGGLLFGAFSPPIALLMVLSGAGDPVPALEVCAVTTALGAAGLFVLRRNRRLGPPVPATTPDHSAPGQGRGSARQGTEMFAIVGLLFGVLSPPTALIMVLSGEGDAVRALEVCAVTTSLGAAGLVVLRRNHRSRARQPATTPEP